MTREKTKLLALIACAVLGILSDAARAAYPEQPISMIVAYAPGGGTDLVARAMAPYIEKYIGAVSYTHLTLPTILRV